MKYLLLTAFSILCVLSAMAQKREEGFNISFKPTKAGIYYYVVTEKEDSLWHRQAYYVSSGRIAMEAWYKDDSCKIPHGRYAWYHPNRYEKIRGNYADGKKEGAWLEFDDEGHLIDSATYTNNHIKGARFKWGKDGMLSDSLQFDGLGNGTEVSWYDNGTVSHAGYWTQDTIKKGRWKYYHHNGKLMATEDYADRKRIACSCYDSTGVQLDSADCIEKEASVDANVWRRFIERGLQRFLESKARAGLRPGQYTVVVRFLVDKEGNVTDVKPLTQYGNGMEEEVVKLFQNAPHWTPGKQFGRIVRSYHTQPVTFVIQTN